jgi:hypothetical protein
MSGQIVRTYLHFPDFHLPACKNLIESALPDLSGQALKQNKIISEL